MAGVVFVFVREDASEAETLAEAFDGAGFAITGSSVDANALSVIVWSRHAARSAAFRQAAGRALETGRAIVASLDAPPSDAGRAPIVDLSGWDGEDSACLDPLFEAADAIVRPAYGNVIELPFRPAYEDAEFVELAPRITNPESERAEQARRAWEAPIPTAMLPVARDEPKTGAPSPRRDFRRLDADRGRPRVYAAMAFALVALGGGAFAVNFMQAPAPAVAVAAEPADAPDIAAMSLTLASAEAVGLEDVVPVEPEAAPQIRSRGVEPGTARRTPRATGRSERTAYAPPQSIPDDILAELQRTERDAPAG
ncbi:MAG: hypothetical protein AB7H66_02870 [Hyphomonadaceae bacterium]